MKRLATTLLGFAAVPFFMSAASAMDLRRALPEDVVEYMPPQAREYYNAAVGSADQLAYEDAIRQLARAAELAPREKELQFLLATHALDRAEVYYGANSFYHEVPEGIDYSSPPWQTAEPYMEIAQGALGRLSQLDTLTGQERRQLNELIERAEDRAGEINERDLSRFETGLPLMLAIHEEKRMRWGLDEPLDLLDIRNAFDRRPRPELLEEEDPDAPPNPFGPLPGEYRPPFQPRYTVAPQQPGMQPGMMDPAMMGPEFQDPAMMGMEGDDQWRGGYYRQPEGPLF